MRTRFAIAFTFIGLLALVGQALLRAAQERQFFELQLIQQRESIAKGLEAKWNEHLLTLAREDKLPKTYSLRWDRLGMQLQSDFFPVMPARLDWSGYRQAVQQQDEPKKREFLEKALREVRTWDRVLAIPEWQKFFGSFPEKSDLSAYENSLVDQEAHDAFARIFQQFSNGRDFALTKRVYESDLVFFKVNEQNEIEAFVPSARELERKILPEFLRVNGVDEAKLGRHPWEIHFDIAKEFEPDRSWLGTGLSIAAVVLLIVGVGLFWLGLQEQKDTLLRRVSFLNQVVHELKTPLAGLKLHAQLMKRSGPTPDTLEAIDLSVNRIDRLFDEIVLINRKSQTAESGYVSAERLNQWADSWGKEYAGAMEVQGVFTQPIYVERKRLDLILRNLICNAIRYGERAKVSIDDSGPRTLISVEDEGPGVSVADSKKIFEEFYRSESAREKSADGLGLGLALVKKLAAEMNVQVQLANPGEPKAKFVVSLPREKT